MTAESGVSTKQQRPKTRGSVAVKIRSGQELTCRILTGRSKSSSYQTRVKDREWVIRKIRKKGVIGSADKHDKPVITRIRRIYKALFGERMPYGVQLLVSGYCDHFSQMVFLEAQDIDDDEDLETAVHELMHVRWPKMSHKKLEEKVGKLVKLARRVK